MHGVGFCGAVFSCALVIATLSMGCGFRVRGEVITPASLADASTLSTVSRQSGFMHHPGANGDERDALPSGIDNAVLADDVSIRSFKGDSICFDVTMRSDTNLDQPLLTLTFEINKYPASVQEPAEPKSTSFDITYDQSLVIARFHHPRLRLTVPKEGTYEVFERHGIVCGTVPPERPVVVELLAKIRGESPYQDFYSRYDWTLIP